MEFELNIDVQHFIHHTTYIEFEESKPVPTKANSINEEIHDGLSGQDAQMFVTFSHL